MGGRAFWAIDVMVVAWRVGVGCFVVYVDIFKVEMDIGCSIGKDAPAELENVT